MILTHEEWVKKYKNVGCHPDFIKSEFNRVKGSEAFPIYPTKKGMLELNVDGDFLQPYKTPDEKTWANFYIFDHSTDLKIRSAIEIAISIKEYETYSLYNWNRKYIDEVLRGEDYRNGNFIVKTVEGKEYGRSTLTHKELQYLRRSDLGGVQSYINQITVEENTKRLIEESLGEQPHREKPVRLWIGGCDDSSYAKCFSDVLEPLDLINKWCTMPPSIDDMNTLKFIFTN
jgi:hypothetical protein